MDLNGYHITINTALFLFVCCCWFLWGGGFFMINSSSIGHIAEVQSMRHHFRTKGSHCSYC